MFSLFKKTPTIVATLYVPVRRLPQGFHRNQLLGRVVNKAVSVHVVLVNYHGEYHGYIGYPTLQEIHENLRTADMEYNCAMIHTPDQVATMGNKLPAEETAQLFPQHVDKIR